MKDEDSQMRDVFQTMQALIESGGHSFRFAPKSLRDLKHDLNKVKRYVATQAADAWVVLGAGMDILQWFADQATPAFSFGGHLLKIGIAGTGFMNHHSRLPRKGGQDGE
ncbi:hypothetical protein KBB96_07090 [Luteolibacter ambystomatis]|uniref:Uncharacterized protein n=2 Tax=Luteolibacter ambystomatis TaxID=2824561 RepID=A0A975J259_9BACT|nr:hypothetical protein [Luteolibacter ambystomatis]QUE52653.1 hypothetical protein KBB96_07090 [Luteolibacter ambystomatis]